MLLSRAYFAGRYQQGSVCQFSREILGLPERTCQADACLCWAAWQQHPWWGQLGVEERMALLWRCERMGYLGMGIGRPQHPPWGHLGCWEESDIAMKTWDDGSHGHGDWFRGRGRKKEQILKEKKEKENKVQINWYFCQQPLMHLSSPYSR